MNQAREQDQLSDGIESAQETYVPPARQAGAAGIVVAAGAALAVLWMWRRRARPGR